VLKCRELVEHTDALLAGELTWSQRLSVRMHLLICHHCRRYVNYLKTLLRAIPGMHGKADDAEVEQVMRHIHDTKVGTDDSKDMN
jgi:anti-sigma factor ChrR (cupin superfamily)